MVSADIAGMHVLILSDLTAAATAQISKIAPELMVTECNRRDPNYMQLLTEAEIVVGGLDTADIPLAKNLRWLQISSAGVGDLPRLLPPHVILTNGSGIYGVPISEHVLAMMLALVREIPAAVRYASAAHWEQRWSKRELFEATCGVVGMGDIGTEVARRAKAFGMRVVAIKRRPTDKPAFVDELWDNTGLDRLVQEADHIVLTLPGTPHTHHLIDSRRISLMKPSACIYNVGRGSVIDEPALVAALQEGRLAGAGLDVFEQEPLPSDNPLWKLPNVIITPHWAGDNLRNAERFSAIFLRNLQAFCHGGAMENVIDREWGY